MAEKDIPILNNLDLNGSKIKNATVPTPSASTDLVDKNYVDTADNALDARLTTAEGDITTIDGSVSTNTTNISTNTSGIATNVTNISTNATNITNLQNKQRVYVQTGENYTTVNAKEFVRVDASLNNVTITLDESLMSTGDTHTLFVCVDANETHQGTFSVTVTTSSASFTTLSSSGFATGGGDVTIDKSGDAYTFVWNGTSFDVVKINEF